MNRPNLTNRRTVLKAITATVAGGVAAGTASAGEPASGARLDRPNRLGITADHDHDGGEHRLELDANRVPSGWTTLEFDNATDHTHFAYLAKLPRAAMDDAGGRDLLDFYVEHVTRPFQWFMDTLVPDKEPDPADLSDRYTDLEAEVIFPPWFGDVLPSGGVGLTAGETTAVSTVHLDPGEYIMECYVKNEEEDFHSYLGMIDHLTVTPTSSRGADPRPHATVDLSLSTDGIDGPDAVRPGQHTVAVRIEDQRIYEHLLGHDLHLIRLDDGTTVDDVNGWTNWMAPGQLVSDGDEPGTFLGGVQTILTPGLLEGSGTETAYVHANLEQGDYAWVSEVPDPDASGLLREFSVTPSAPTTGAPPAAPGDSRNWGSAGEHSDDDLSERSATSRMDDDLKSLFDRVANHDEEDFQS